MLGFSYNTSQTVINVGIHAPAFTEEINSFLTSLQEEGYKIVKYDNIDDCVEDIKLGFVHTCLKLPENFKISDNFQKEITFHIDQSKINLVYLITDTLNKKFNLKSEEISQELSSGLLTKLFNTKTKIEEKSGTVDEVKSKNQQAVSQSTTIRSNLISLDLKAPEKNYNNSIVSSFKNATTSKIKEGISLLSEAKLKVDASDLNSSEKAAINNKISGADTQFDKLLNLINDTGAGSLEEISNMISSMQNDLEMAKRKLNDATDKISSAGSQLVGMTTTLNEGIASLDVVKTTLNDIQADLASQKVTNAATIASPITTKIEKITSEKTNLSYLFPSLIILAVMFISMLLGTTLVMMEKHNQAYFRNFILPVRKITFVLSTYLTNCFLMLIQIAIILGISLIFLENVSAKFPPTILVLFISSSVFTLIGMIIGYVFISEETGALASISTSSFLLFISGVVLPLESMPLAIRQVVSFNPFVISEKLIREIFIFNSSFSVILNDLFILLGYAVVLFIAILIIDSIASKHFLTRAAYKHHKHLREKEKKAKLN